MGLTNLMLMAFPKSCTVFECLAATPVPRNVAQPKSVPACARYGISLWKVKSAPLFRERLSFEMLVSPSTSLGVRPWREHKAGAMSKITLR